MNKGCRRHWSMGYRPRVGRIVHLQVMLELDVSIHEDRAGMWFLHKASNKLAFIVVCLILAGKGETAHARARQTTLL